MRKFFKQFSFPGHIGSHVTPETPGSIHEGGELGYSLSHAYGMAFDNPDLIVACVVGDGEAETGPLATAWHSNKFLNPARDGAVLPILNLNGYKIANPTILARISQRGARGALRRLRLQALLRRGQRPAGDAPEDGRDAGAGRRRDPRACSERRGETSDADAPALADDRAARAQGVDRAQGARRAQAGGLLALAPGPVRRRAAEPGAPQGARGRGCGATGPRSCSTRSGTLVPELRALSPKGRAAHERQPARQRRACCARSSSSPTSAPTRCR